MSTQRWWFFATLWPKTMPVGECHRPPRKLFIGMFENATNYHSFWIPMLVFLAMEYDTTNNYNGHADGRGKWLQ
jgi:hypothetical protein